MRLVEQVFALVLRLYPAPFRARFGDEMRAFVRERTTEHRVQTPAGTARLLSTLVVDGIAGAVREHAAVHLARHRRLATTDTFDSTESREEMMHTLVLDIRYALRTLRRRAAFTIVSTATLALGIGATAAIFGVVDSLLFRPLRYPSPEQLVVVSMTRGSVTDAPPSYADFVDWREAARSFQSLAVIRWQSVNLTGRDTPERLSGSFTSASLFSQLGAEPLQGRLFSADETEIGSGRPVAVISEGFWRRRFGAEPSVVGSPLVMNGQPFTVIGIVPASFTFFAGTDVWLPITYYPNAAGLTRKDHSMTVVGRLQRGVTVAAADREMRAIAARLAERYPDENGGTGAAVRSLHDVLVGDARPQLYTVLAAVGLLLLIACANVANLQLSNAMARRREMSVRAALGAGRSRLARQLLTESLILSALGALVGIAVAYGGVRVLVSLIPMDLTFFAPIAVDARVMAFAGALAITTGLVFGLVPALQGSRSTLKDALTTRTGSLAARIGRLELRTAFVVAQIALSVVLLAGSGLLARTLVKLRQVDLGFDPSHVLTLEFRLPATKYRDPEQISAFFTRAIAEVRAVPGVTTAALARAIPLSGNSDGRAYAVAGAPEPAEGQAPTLQLNTVSTDYFRTVRLPLVGGRDFVPQDDAAAPGVVIVNETLARRAWPTGSAIGHRIRFIDSDEWLTVVGVAHDAKHFGPADPPTPQAYVPYRQHPQIFTSLAVRSAGDPLALAKAVQDAIWRVDPEQPMWKIRSLESLVEARLGSKRVLLGLVSAFAVVSALLAGLGIYGVMSFAVTQRTHEVGVRMALGARGGEVLRLIVGQGMRLTSIALVIGLIASVGAARLLASQLFGVSPTDPLTFAVVAVVLAVVAVLGCYLPARRASRLDPLVALRQE